MASHGGKQPSSALLWTIIPVAVLLTLLFVRFNNHAVDNKARLDGELSVSKVEMKHEAAPAEHAPMTEGEMSHDGAESHEEAAH
ncbi:MAG: hypothetical protein R2809_09645 [Flavobacteriales bacterium]